MKISYKWLQDYFKDSLPPQEKVAETLTMKAYEVEGILDGVLNIDVLPNRSHDSLGYLGVAREVGVLLDQELKLPEVKYQTDDSQKTSDFITLQVDDEKLAPRAMKRVVLDVKVGESPDWLKEKLACMGQKSINNIVDITNFVMWETGQPVHAFDLDKVSPAGLADKKQAQINADTKISPLGRETSLDVKRPSGDLGAEGVREITIRGAKEGEKIITLDGVEYELREGMLVIADAEKALDIAGIKGGVASGIDLNTKRIMLSVCNFNPAWIRKTSKALSLRTDASQRFENGITPKMTEGAMERMSGLIAELTGGRVLSDILDSYSDEAKKVSGPYKISVSLEEINKVLGSEMKDAEVRNILERFSKHANFQWRKSDDKYVVEIPPERLDLREGPEPMVSGNKEDLIEEIGRVYGYEKIESTLPPVLEPKINKVFYYTELLKDILVRNGFSEVITYSFQSEGSVKVANPLSSDKKYLRNSLRPGLKKALELNNKNKPLFGSLGIKMFEVGKVFEKEKEYLSLGVATEDKNSVDFIRMKLEEILGQNGELKDNVLIIDFNPEELADINSYDELSTDLTETKKFKEISAYPFVLRDIALWTTEDEGQMTEVGEVEKVIKDMAGDYLVNINLFDTYEKDNRVSYAFNLVFQSNDKTLTDVEVGDIMKKVEEALVAQGWEVR
jgi:phenylalanyl-tRNA synthetase beta chain